MLYSLWAGKTSGTMNDYNPQQLTAMGHALGKRYAGVPNVIFCVGGEATPNYVDVDRTNALGLALKKGCAGRNLVTVHTTSKHSGSEFFANSSWLDFSMSQGNSSNQQASTDYDASSLVTRDWETTPTKPALMAEHRYESGIEEDPLIQRRLLYQCVFAGAFGHGYGHNALWPMTPHSANGWAAEFWAPGVKKWTDALDTPAARQLHHIKKLLYSRPYLTRIPDQNLVLTGQGKSVATRIQATRDGTAENNEATYLMAYLSAPIKVTLNTAVISAKTLNAYWFSPETGSVEMIKQDFANTGSITLEPKPKSDWVVVVDDARRNYLQPGKN